MGKCFTNIPNEQSTIKIDIWWSLTIIYKPNDDEYHEYQLQNKKYNKAKLEIPLNQYDDECHEYQLKAKAYDEVTLKVYGHETINNIIHRLSKCPSFNPPQNKYFSVNQMELFHPNNGTKSPPLHPDQRIYRICSPAHRQIILYAKYPRLKVPSCDDQDITVMPSNHEHYRRYANYFEKDMKGKAKLLDMYQINKGHTVDMQIFEAIRKSKNNAKIAGLCHGTSFENAGNIIKGGFDRTYNTRSAYGYGTYLAASPATASSYCRRYHGQTKHPIYCMLFCNTIVGNMGSGGSGYRAHGNYDSLVDNVRNPSIFVIYKDYHAIPVYLMVFRYDDDNHH